MRKPLTKEEWRNIRIEAGVMILEKKPIEAHKLLEFTFRNFEHPVDRGMELIGMLFILDTLISSKALYSMPVPQMQEGP